MATLGNKRKCYVGATSSSSTTYALLTGETSNNITLNNTLVDISDKAAEYQKFISGIKGGTGSASVHADDTDTQQKTLLDSLEAGGEVPIFIGELGSSSSALTGSKGFAFMAIINSISETNDNGSVSTRDFSYTISGAWTHYPTA